MFEKGFSSCVSAEAKDWLLCLNELFPVIKMNTFITLNALVFWFIRYYEMADLFV